MTEPEFRKAFQSNKDVLYRFVYRMTGSSSVAEDVAQECFLILWRRPDAYNERRGAIRAFLLGIARNLVLKQWRNERIHESLDDDFLSCPPIDSSKDRREIVQNAVRQLPPLQREALILAEYEEMSLEEIAEATNSELAAVKSRIHRARNNLRLILRPLLEGKGDSCGTRR